MDIAPDQVALARQVANVDQEDLFSWLAQRPERFDLLIGLDIVERFARDKVRCVIPCRLVIVGSLSEKQRLLLTENGIAFDSHVNVSHEILVAVYRRCHYMVFASRYECCGLSLIVVQAVARVVVISNRCSMAGIASNAACLGNPENGETIREKILRLIWDEPYLEELVREGAQNVSHFASEQIAPPCAEVYRGLGSLGKVFAGVELQPCFERGSSGRRNAGPRATLRRGRSSMFAQSFAATSWAASPERIEMKLRG